MYKTIRKSVAEAIATVENPDQFLWDKWLRQPQIYLERFAKPRVEIKKIDSFSKFEQPTLYQVKRFRLSKFKISEEIKNVLIKKKKTFKVFVTFPKTGQHEVKILRSGTIELPHCLSIYWKKKDLYIKHRSENKDSYYKISPQTTHFEITSLGSKTGNNLAVLPNQAIVTRDLSIRKVDILDCILVPLEEFTPPLVSSNNAQVNINSKRSEREHLDKLNKKPKIKEFPLVNLDDIKQDCLKSLNRIVNDVPLDSLDQKPKLYLVKFQDIEKKRVALFQLKNIWLTNATLKNFNSVTINEPEISRHVLNEELQYSLQIENTLPLIEVLTTEKEDLRKALTKVNIKTENIDSSAIEVNKLAKLAESQNNCEVIHHEPILENISANECIPNHLLQYQKEGIRYLLDEQTAVLSYELGIDKVEQTVHALAIKIRQGKVNASVIICPSANIGDKSLNLSLEHTTGWENIIHYSYPDLKFTTIRYYDSESFKENEKSNILIFNYSAFFSWISDESTKAFIYNLDCIIFDEVQNLLRDQAQLESLKNLPDLRHTWMLTSLPRDIIKEQVIPNLKQYLPAVEYLNELNCQSRSSIQGDIPEIQRHDYWLKMDREQTQEFENILLQGRKRIFDLVKGGNPFLIQSNIFTLVHQIKQLSNFSSLKDHSPKSELLLEQLESIIASEQKAIIFSQYDKQGIQKIERLLKNNNIRYVLYQAGMPIKELENSAAKFKKDSKISVMLTGLTSANLKVRIPNAHYIIHFDQWWNPIVQWHFEDKTLNPEDDTNHNSPVNIFSYYGNNSVEIKIRETLLNKGLMTQSLVEFLSNETIYSLMTNEDWLDILEIEHSRSLHNEIPDLDAISNKIAKMPNEEIFQKIKLLFTKLGFKNLILKPDAINDTVVIFGSVNKNLQEIKIAVQYASTKVKSHDPIVKFRTEASKHNNRVFVICADEMINQLNNINNERVAYIGQRMLANYFSLFKII